MEEAEAGLRERKKRRTREAIVDSAMDLFEERGFEGTTVADIAERADIAPRTYFAYFPTKEDVVFADFEETLASLQARLGGRQPGETAIDALRAWLVDRLGEADFKDKRERCKRRLIRENPSLDAHERHLHGQFQATLGEAIAEDVGGEPTDMRARMVAASAVAAFDKLGEYYKDDAGPKGAAFGDDPMAAVDDALRFLRAGIEALQEAPAPRR
jgi:AcrR family transcriptional regulator